MQVPSLKEVVTHPISTASAIFGLVVYLLNIPLIDVLGGFVWSNIGTIFGTMSIVATFLAPRVAFLPARELTILALVAAVGLVVKRTTTIGDKLIDKLTRGNK